MSSVGSVTSNRSGNANEAFALEQAGQSEAVEMPAVAGRHNRRPVRPKATAVVAPKVTTVAMANSSAGEEEAPFAAEEERRKKREEEEEERKKKKEDEEAEKDEFPVFLQDEFEDLDSEEQSEGIGARLESAFVKLRTALNNSLSIIKYIVYFILTVGYTVYFGFAMACSFGDEGSIRLLVMTLIILFCLAVYFIRKYFGDSINNLLSPIVQSVDNYLSRHKKVLKIVGVCCFFVYFGGIAIAVGSQNPSNLMSVVGVITVVLICLLLSTYPTKVNWRPVLGGLTLQITFAALMLRTQPGYEAFSFLGDRVAEFIQHVDEGSRFVFGDSFGDHFFAFSVLSVIVFFSSFVALMFHLGILQMIIEKLGWVMQRFMGTTSGESLVAAANIFVGQTEAPLMIRPFVGRMTNSELHSVITCGYATIAGGVLAAYIGQGVPARHLLSASVMVAPGALALSKIAYPETKKSLTQSDAIKKIKMSNYHNAIEAIGTGAINSIGLVAAIAVNLIAFITTLTFLNSTLTWLGHRACLSVDLTFELICGYALWPLAFLIGVDSVDSQRVGELIGVKFFINEFVAYQKFSVYRSNYMKFNSLNTTGYYWDGNDVVLPMSNVTLTGGLLFKDRSLTIATYALCGFANISSIGMQLGMLAILMPRRKAEIVPLVLRGVIVGTMANLLTASVAGIFYEPNL